MEKIFRLNLINSCQNRIQVGKLERSEHNLPMARPIWQCLAVSPIWVAIPL